MLKKEISDEVVKKTLLDYFNEIAKYAPDQDELERVKRRPLLGRRSSLTIPLLRQTYELFGFEDEKTSIYQNFIKIIEENFSIDRNVVEVAGGPISSLSFQIASRQTKGTVTVYDPLMYPTKYNLDNLIIKKEKFTLKTKVPEGSLIVGFMPCEATQTLLEYATNNKLDFIVALCGCPPYNDCYGYEDDIYYDWLGNMKYLALRGIEDNDLGELGIASLKEFDDPYPIYFNKKLKK